MCSCSSLDVGGVTTVPGELRVVHLPKKPTMDQKRRAHWMRVGRRLEVVKDATEPGDTYNVWTHEDFNDPTRNCWMGHRTYETALRHWVSQVMKVETSLRLLERAYIKSHPSD